MGMLMDISTSAMQYYTLMSVKTDEQIRKGWSGTCIFGVFRGNVEKNALLYSNSKMSLNLKFGHF